MQLASQLFALALFSLPLIGVGSLELVRLPSLGGGFQPSIVFGWLALGIALLTKRGRTSFLALPMPLLLAVGVTLLSSSYLWTMNDMGLFGEAPWSKGTKQSVVLLLYMGVATVPAILLHAESGARAHTAHWERALSAGLLLAGVYGIAQAVDYYVALPGMDRADAWFSSNPSIAAGSHELYLGHRFVGIPRIRATACEPLYFGSYLLAVIPFTLLALRKQVGWPRVWRLVAAATGIINLILTFSRGVYAAAAVGIFLAALLWWRGGRPRLTTTRQLMAVVSVGAVIILSISALSGTAPWALPRLLVERSLQTLADHDMSNLTRFFAWRAAWSAFLASPFLGHGWGSFGFLYYPLAPPAGAGAHFGWPVANSIPLRILVETGLVGILLWGWVFLPVARELLRVVRLPLNLGFAAFLGGLLLMAGTQSLTHSQIQLPHLWILAGLALYHARPAPPMV